MVAFQIDGLEFHVHKKLLFSRTPDIFNSPSSIEETDEDQVYSLNGYDLHILEMYIRYVYTGELPSKDEEDWVGDGSEEMDRLLAFYQLSQEFTDTGAMDAATSAILANFGRPGDMTGYLPSSDDIANIYNTTSSRSPLRRLIVDLFIWESKPGHFDHSESCPEFLLDLSQALMAKHTAMREKYGISHGMDEASCCDYHEHKKDAPCPSEKRKRDDSDDGSNDD